MEPTALESVSRAFSGGPAYDSGWVYLGQDEAKTLTHNLGGNVDNYVVDMQYYANSVDGINLRYYGGWILESIPLPVNGVNTLTHHLGGNLNAYAVRYSMCSTVHSVNILGAGSMEIGGN